uniref:DNAX-activation protein 10 n=1 Tax=Salvator merianae TaxID=96440 RepID=A0A8D0EAG1_SALMN
MATLPEEHGSCSSQKELFQTPFSGSTKQSPCPPPHLPKPGSMEKLTVHISGLKGSVNCPADDPTWKDNKDQALPSDFTPPLAFLAACEDCVELGIAIMAGIVLSDLLVTLIVLALVYYCSRSRAARAASSMRDTCSFFSQPIRKGQRDVYAGLQAKAF